MSEKSFIKIVGLLGFLVFTTKLAYASGCLLKKRLPIELEVTLDVQKKADYLFKTADVVFIGKPFWSEKTVSQLEGRDPLIIKSVYAFDVKEMIKSSEKLGNKIKIVHEQLDCSCSYEYEFGVEYKIYGFYDKQNLKVYNCQIGIERVKLAAREKTQAKRKRRGQVFDL